MTTAKPSIRLPGLQAFLARMLAAFHAPGFAWLWGSSTLGAMNLMAGSMTLGWLVLELTDSPFWVGAIAAARGLGQLGFGAFAGVLIDRLDQRRLLLLAQLGSGALPLLLGLLVLVDRIALWQILGASLLLGAFFSIRAPASNMMAYHVTGPKRVLNASAAMNMGFNLARVIASAVAGALIVQWGIASGLFFSAACAFVGGALLLFIGGAYRPESATGPEPFWGAMAAGVRYAWATLSVRRLLSLSVIMEMFGFSHNIMLPVMARDVLGVDASGLGLLSSLGGIGAVLSTLGIASLGDYKRKGSLLALTVASSGGFLLLFGLSRWYLASLVLVFWVGAALAAYDVTIKAMFLLVASDQVRGRVQSLYTLTYSFMSLGGFVAGSIATAVGAPVAITASGGIILAFTVRYLRSIVQPRPLADGMVSAGD